MKLEVRMDGDPPLLLGWIEVPHDRRVSDYVAFFVPDDRSTSKLHLPICEFHDGAGKFYPVVNAQKVGLATLRKVPGFTEFHPE